MIITPRIPYPPYRGDKLKIFNLSKVLIKNNNVHIITFYQNKKDEIHAGALEELGIKIYLVRLTLFESLLHAFLAIFESIPFQVAWYKSSKMDDKIESLIDDEKFDVIYYHLIRTAQYLLPRKNSTYLNIIDFTDAVSLYLSRMVENEKNIFKKVFIKSELKRITNYEKVAEKFDTIFICSEIDKKFLIEKGFKQDIQILNNGIDTNYFFGDQKEYDQKRIIFTGNMPYYANTDAAIYFAKEILPFILKKDPEVKFYIVGQKPPLSIRQLECGNIIVTGYVEDIKAEYLKSAVNVAPMRFGAGTLNKVIESIALGIPVIATPIAVAGLPRTLEEFVYIADSPKEFATKTFEILNDKKIRSERMKIGKDRIRETLSWDIIINNFEQFLITKLKEKKKN